jgi:hypothetical protein
VLAADAKAHVYWLPEREQLVGCVYGHAHVYALGPSGAWPALSAVRKRLFTISALAGPMVAVAGPNEFEPPVGSPETHMVLTVTDLRSGRVVHRAATQLGGCNSIFRCDERPSPVLLAEDGSVAWATSTTNREGGVFTEILAFDKTGLHVLARGWGQGPWPEIDQQSLTLTGSTLQWVQNGKLMSATLD